MTRNVYFSLLFACTLISSTALANEPTFERQTRFSVLGGINLTDITSSDPTNVDPSYGLDPTLATLVSTDIDEDFEIETGLIFSRQKVDFSASYTSSYSSEFSTLEIPLVMRYHFSPHLSGGGGLYYSALLGRVVTDAPSNTLPPPAGGFNRNDFGAIFNVRGNMPLTTNIQGILDVRYLLGVINLGPFSSANNREMQFLLGASFTL